jgi:hypothetical protein
VSLLDGVLIMDFTQTSVHTIKRKISKTVDRKLRTIPEKSDVSLKRTAVVKLTISTLKSILVVNDK